MKRLLIVEDDSIMRGGLYDVIATCQDVFHKEIEIATTGTWEGALALIESFQPDAVLLDLTFAPSDKSPGQDKLETIEKLRLLSLEWPPVVILTGAKEDEIRRMCFEAGASDFILKTHRVMKYPESIAERVYNAFLRRKCRINHGPC